jgi:hypothetical protein
VNPKLKIKALAMVYNPLDEAIERDLVLGLYYAGLKDTAKITERDGRARTYRLDREYRVTAPVRMGPKSVTWLVVE